MGALFLLSVGHMRRILSDMSTSLCIDSYVEITLPSNGIFDEFTHTVGWVRQISTCDVQIETRTGDLFWITRRRVRVLA